MQHKSDVLPLQLLLTQAINSDSYESVTVVNNMMKKNGMTVAWDMIQAARKRGVTKIIETLTGDPYDADHEKENVKLSILSGCMYCKENSVAGIV